MAQALPIEQAITSFLDTEEKRGNSPDMLSIMTHVSLKAQCEPIDVLRKMAQLQQTLEVLRVRVGVTVTYVLTNNL
jgi:hypothetical protein